MRTILFIDETAKIGGAEMNLIRIVARLQEEGWKPVLLVPEHGSLVEKLAACGVSSQIVPGGPFYSISSYIGNRLKVPNPLAWIATPMNGRRWARALERAIRQIQPDVVQTVSMLSHLFGGWAGRKAGCPVVSHIQDIVAKNSSLGIYHAVFQAWARRIPSRKVCVSPLVARQFPINLLARSSTQVIWNMVDLDRIQSADRSPQDDSKAKIQIGTVARLTRWKGQHIALQVAYWLKEVGIDFQWRFVGNAVLGEQDYARQLYNQVKQLQLESEVCFTGWQENMLQSYSSLDLLVHLPIEPDPAPLVVTEALLCGLPVVASHTGLDEIVREAGGILVPAGDARSAANAIVDFIKQLTSQRADYRQKARATALKYFSPQTVIPQWLQLYEEVLAA